MQGLRSPTPHPTLVVNLEKRVLAQCVATIKSQAIAREYGSMAPHHGCSASQPIRKCGLAALLQQLLLALQGAGVKRRSNVSPMPKTTVEIPAVTPQVHDLRRG